MSGVSANNKIPILDFVDGELTLKTSFHDVLQSTLSHEGQDFPVAFIGIFGGKGSGKSFTGDLVQNYLSIHGLGLRTKLTTAIAQARQPSPAEREGVSGAVCIWEKPFLIETGGKLIKVFMLEFASSEISEANHQEEDASLVSFSKSVCSRLVEVVTYEKSRVLSPDTLFNRRDEKTSTSPSFSVVYVFQSCGYRRKLPKTLKDDINKISRILKSQVEVVQMEEIGDNTTPLILSSTENCIKVILNEDEFSAKSGLTLETIEAHLASCCGQVNTRFQPKLESSNEPRRRRLSGSFGSWRRKSKKRTSMSSTHQKAEDQKDKPVEEPIPMPRSQSLSSHHQPPYSHQNSQDFYKYLEASVTKIFNQKMSAMLTEKQTSFSAPQLRKIYAILCTHIFEIFPGRDFESNQLIILEEKLETHFKQHQQTNLSCLAGKAKQVEIIIHTFKTNYNNHRFTRAETNTNSDEELAQYLKLKIWAKVGPNEPIEVHWACLKSQIDSSPLLQLEPEANLAEPEPKQVCLGFQLNHKSIIMGIWKEGECVQLENERGELETPMVVALTAKGRNLVYGSQVYRAEKKGTLASTYHIGKHFGRNSDSELGEIFELPLKNKVSQVGIEFFLGYLLKKLKTCAERQIQIEALSCVITVPCQFASYQRLEVKYSAVAAGFREVRVMSDTSAAAIEYALFSKERENSSFSNFRILCESNGNLYGGTCTFDKGATNISLKIGGKHFSIQGRTKVKYEKKAEVLYSYVTQLYQDLLLSGDGGSLNHVVLVLYEQPEWGRALTYVSNMNGSMTTEGSPLQGAIHKFQNFRGEILETLPYKIQFLSEKGTFSSAIEEQHFAIEVHSQETYFSQQIFGRTTHPIGIVRLNQFYPEVMKYTISFERSEEGHISLEGLSAATRRSLKELVSGNDFTWESGQNLLRSRVPEHILLLKKLFSRSYEEVKRVRREQNEKVRKEGKKRGQNEVYPHKQPHFIQDVCAEI